MDTKNQAENAYDSFSHVCDRINGPKIHTAGSKRDQSNTSWEVSSLLQVRGPGIIRVIWCSCHFGVVWAHSQWPTEDAGRRVVGLFSMAFGFVLFVECGFHKHRKFVKWFLVFCSFLLTEKKMAKQSVRSSSKTATSDIHSISKGVATRSERNVRIGVLR